MLDSIYGSNSFIQDWLYFTPNNRFWRFTYFDSSYIIDSNLSYTDSIVIDGNNVKYTISVLEDDTILLTDIANNNFRARRWNEYDSTDIISFLEANHKKLLLNGKRSLGSSEATLAYLPSYCRNLFPVSKFHFTENGILEIYPTDSAKACNHYSYKIFDDRIVIIEYDMLMELKIIQLTKDLLILKSTYLPEENYSARNYAEVYFGYKMYFSK